MKFLKDWLTLPSRGVLNDLLRFNADVNSDLMIKLFDEKMETKRLRAVCDRCQADRNIVADERDAATKKVERLSGFLEKSEAEEAGLHNFIYKMDDTVSDALKAVDRFPGPPAGCPDRNDTLAAVAIEFHGTIERLRKIEEDYIAAAGELLVSIPDVGTDTAKLLHANVMMRKYQIPELQAEIKRLSDELDTQTVNADDAEDDLEAQEGEGERLSSENDSLKAKVERLSSLIMKETDSARIVAINERDASAIQAVLGNGSDKKAWPPGTHYADALGPYVYSLLAEIDLRDKDFMQRRDGTDHEIESLRVEADRLRGLLMQEADSTQIVAINVADGHIDLLARPPHWAMLAVAQSFYETLADAPNWQSLQVGPMDCRGISLVVTVRRLSGETPEETVTKCKDMIEELLIHDGGTAGKEVYAQNLFDRARALLNPSKKDS